MNDDGMLNAETQRKLPQGEILQPKLRFKGFTDPWQQRKLEELLIPAKAKNVDGKFTKNDVLSVSGEFGIVNQIALKGKSSAGESVLLYSVVNWGDAVYTKSPLKEAPYGIIKVNQGRAGIVSTLYAVYTLRQHLIVPVFLELYFDSNVRLNNYLKPLVNKGAKNDMKVKNVDVLKGHIHITPNVVEQARIAEFFRVLDDRIAAAKKKADLLKLKKRYYLQAIFNQRLRFKGFTEPWQQRKLGELFKERSERSNQGELISVTITNGVVPASSLERKDNSSEDKSNYKQVKTGDIAYNTMRMWQGASGVSPYSGILSPAYTVLIPSSEVSSSFFAQMFKLVRMLHLFQRYSQGLTSDTWNLKYPLLSEIRVTIPSLAEQERISEFLVLNDELTALVKKKAEDLQKIKSYYLQQLFV